MSTRTVILTTARCGHKYDPKGRFIGVFSEPIGAKVEMPVAEAERYLERGLATLPPNEKK